MTTYSAVPSPDSSHWTVLENGRPLFGPVTEEEARAIAREMNAHPDNPWS
jgi:hypothetical protein